MLPIFGTINKIHVYTIQETSLPISMILLESIIIVTVSDKTNDAA